MSATVTVSIGRNVGAEPMPVWEWHDVAARIESGLAECGAEVFVKRAESVGEWVTADGVTVSEDSRTWVAAMDVEALVAFRRLLRVLCVVYRQDAIALTVGTTELVSGAES